MTTTSLVGRNIRLVRYQGARQDVQGTIEEDTKHTLVVRTRSGNKTYRKAELICTIEGIPSQIEGNTLIGKVHERIKKYT